MLLFYKKIIMVKHELKTNGKFSQINAQVKLYKLRLLSAQIIESRI